MLNPYVVCAVQGHTHRHTHTHFRRLKRESILTTEFLWIFDTKSFRCSLMSRNLIISYQSSTDSQFVKDDDAAICLGSMRIHADPCGSMREVPLPHQEKAREIFDRLCHPKPRLWLGKDMQRCLIKEYQRKKLSHLNITPHWLTSTFGFIWS